MSDESNEEESETDNKEKSLSDGERMSAFLICYTRIDFTYNKLLGIQHKTMLN